MSDSHWEKAARDSQRYDPLDEAPPLPDNDLEELASRVTRSVQESGDSTLSSQEAIDRILGEETMQERTQRHTDALMESMDRKRQFKEDKAEADEQGISVGELRQMRHEQEQEEPEPEAEQPEEPVPLAEPEGDELGDIAKQVVDLLGTLVADVAEIKQNLAEAEGGHHG